MITPREIETKEFSRAKTGGYRPEEVDSFLDEILLSYTKLLEEKETALRIATQNGEAAKRSVGSLEGDGDGEELSDFLIGFNSIYD